MLVITGSSNENNSSSNWIRHGALLPPRKCLVLTIIQFDNIITTQSHVAQKVFCFGLSSWNPMRRYNWNKIRLQCGWTLCPTVYLTLFFVRKYPAWWFNAENENGVLFLKFIHGYCAVMCHKEQRGHPANKRKGSHSRHKALPSPSLCKSARAALHLAVSCQALKIVAPATEVWIYFSVQATLTTTKSPAIPDTLLGCQSCRTCQNSYRTTGFCEAEDKAEPLNKNQIHNPSAFIHLAFPLSPSPSRPVQAGSYSSNHLQSLFPGPRQTILFYYFITY